MKQFAAARGWSQLVGAFVAAIACIGYALNAPVHAASVLPLHLEEMIDTAAVAFEGTVTENRAERDPATGFIATYTTFAVSDVLKGEVGATHTIKQVGGSLPDGKLQYRVEGVPSFVVGQSYVVFLAGVSSAGFSSPIGLEQGRFHVKDEGGVKHVSNGRDFKDMTSRMRDNMPARARAEVEQTADAVKHLDLDDFKKSVRNHRGGAR
jgi:hypothetical protein